MIKNCVCCDKVIDGFEKQKYCVNCSLYVRDLRRIITQQTTRLKELEKRLEKFKIEALLKINEAEVR